MKYTANYDYEILYKFDKENVIADILFHIQINAISIFPDKIIIMSIINDYHFESFKRLIKSMKKKHDTSIRYKIQDKLLYYRIDEYES